MPTYVVTYICNNNCVSCISNRAVLKQKKEPSIEEIKRWVDKIEKNADHIGITGGEPTLRKDLFEILSYIRERHPQHYIFLVTNGRMFCYERYVQKLANLNLNRNETPYFDLFRIGVALYSHIPEIHDLITRVPGSWDQTVQGIKNLTKYNLKVELRIIVNKFNYKILPETAKFIVNEFHNLDRIVFINMAILGNAFINKDKIAIKYSDAVPHVEKAVDILIKNKMNVKTFHFPLCIIKRKYWKIAKGITKEESDLTFVKQCKECVYKNDCARIWKSYPYIMGTSEFHAIKKFRGHV